MTAFDEIVRELCTLHGKHGYRLAPALVRGSPGTQVKVVFDRSVFETAILALPSVRLGDGGPNDRFSSGSPDKPQRLAATLSAIDALCARHPMGQRVLQLGDWFDVFETAAGGSPLEAISRIESVAAYELILRLDAKMGLSHVIGNHDACFLSQVPSRRAHEPERFRLGFWVGSKVYALHGHEAELVFGSGPAAEHEQRLHALATTLADLVPGKATFCAHVEMLRASPAVKRWLQQSLGTLRPDPPPESLATDERPRPPGVVCASFVERRSGAQLLDVVRELERLDRSRERRADVILSGHGSEAAVSWAPCGGRPVVIIDAGTWTGAQANLLIAAGDTAAVFEVRPA